MIDVFIYESETDRNLDTAVERWYGQPCVPRVGDAIRLRRDLEQPWMPTLNVLSAEWFNSTKDGSRAQLHAYVVVG